MVLKNQQRTASVLRAKVSCGASLLRHGPGLGAGIELLLDLLLDL
jgi:hypothetical protein